MNERVALAVCGDKVAAVVAKSGAATREHTTTTPSEADIATSVEEALRGVGRGGRSRRVEVVFCAPRSQVRRLDGLPEAGPRVINSIVTENPSRFFFQLWPRTYITPVWRSPEGGLFAAAFDAKSVDEVVSAARVAGFRVSGVFGDPSALSAEAAAMRRAVDAVDGPHYQPGARERRATLQRAVRTLSIGFVCALLLAVWLGRGVRASLERRDLESRLKGSEPLERQLAGLRSELQRAEASRSAFRAVEKDRKDMLILLARLTACAPESTTILSLRIDTAEVTMVAAAPRIADMALALAESPGVHSLRIAGAISADGAAGALERATFRFRRRAAPAARGRRT